VSRYRENTSYRIAHVFYRQREVLDALVWLGTGQKQARHLVRLVRLGDGIGVRMYLTNVCDPQLLSLGEVARLYARRWDIELAFRLLKEYLGMSHWWSSKPELILVQIWIVLILSHLVYALREQIALAAACDPFEVSVPLLVDLLPRLGSSCPFQLEQLVQSGRKSGLLRASPRLVLKVPQVALSCYQPVPPICPDSGPDVPHRLRGGARLSRPSACVAIRCSGRGGKHPNKPRRSDRLKPKQLKCQRESPDPLLI